MQDVFDLVETVAPTNSTILVTGESGTGKELVARAVHTNSLRRDQAFVALNCGALPETLLESELFGHMRGAFTGAATTKKGLLEAAERGTVFLDEISEMSTDDAGEAAAGCSRSGSSGASAAPRKSTPTSASSPPPTAIWRGRCRKAGSARTSTTAST